MGEDELIARYFAPLAGRGSLDLKDDTALIRPPPGAELVITADAVVAGVHFFPGDGPDTIARKALGVNLSDLAAKGADPLGYLLTLALPDGWTEPWLAAFCRGLGKMAGEFACPLLGGDTVRTPGPLTISVTALGTVPTAGMVARTSASADQAICVTGTIGDAALGLALAGPTEPHWAARLGEADRAFLVDRYHVPQPRLALARALREHAAAAMDVSDGFAGDLSKLLRVSGVGGGVDLDRVPLSPAARNALEAEPALNNTILTGGDDYEILCTVPQDRLNGFVRAAAEVGISISVVGQTRPEPGLTFRRDGREDPLVAASFSHF